MNAAVRKPLPVYRAYAKINLGLEILGKRPDGFHEIATIMQTIELHDDLTLTPSDQLKLRSNVSEVESPDNLVLRAAHELRAAVGTDRGASIYLDKHIPLAAGLGGGSSDAACALQALSSFWQLNLRQEDLIAMGARLGSDVSFFFYGGIALARGRGEIITPLPSLRPYNVVLVCPRVYISEKTRRLYSRISPAQYSDGRAVDRMAETLRNGKAPDLQASNNTFQSILLGENAAVRACYDRFMLATSHHILLSGAGPSLFTLTPDESEARMIGEAMRGLDADIFLTRTINSPPFLRRDAEG